MHEDVNLIVADAADAAASPIVGVHWDQAGPGNVGRHRHRRGQLLSTQRGCAVVETDAGRFVLPPHRGLWLPPETPHAVRYPREVAFRGLFIVPEQCVALPRRCAIMPMDALIRELVDVAVRLPWDYASTGPEARLLRVLLDRLVTVPTEPLQLPDVRDPRLRRVVDALRADPADDRPLAHWARSTHMSERTLARLFQADTGMSFTNCRQQLRLLMALERLAAGDPVTTVAIDLGYRSTSSFTTMFKRAVGVPPSVYFADGPPRDWTRGRRGTAGLGAS